MKGLVQRSQVICALIYAVLLCGADSVAQALSGHVSPLRCLVVGGLGLILACVATVASRPVAGYSARTGSPARNWRTGLICAGVAFVFWMALYGVYYPMASMNDTMTIIEDPIVHSNQHPLAYNVALAGATRISQHLFGNYLVGIVVFAVLQMLVWAAVLGGGCAYLRWLGASSVAIGLVTAWCVINPLIGDYTFAAVKDALWSPFVIALVLLSHYAVVSRNRGAALGWAYWVLVAMSLIGFMVFRNNALAVGVFVVIALIVWTRKNWRRAVPVLICAFLIGVVPSQVAAHMAAKQRFTEAVGIPIQTIAYTYAHDRSCIPAEEAAYFGQLMTPDQWVSRYNPTNVDSIKYSADFKGDVIEDGSRRFIAEWADFAAVCPTDVAHAYLLHTQDGWRLDSTSLGSDDQSYFSRLVSNGCGYEGCEADYVRTVTTHGVQPDPWWSAQTVAGIDAHAQAVASGPLGKVGPWVWILALIGSGFISRRRVAEALALLGPAILVWGSLMAATPTFHPFRYFEFSVGLAAFAAAILMATPSAAAFRSLTSTEEYGARSLPSESTA